MAIVGCLRFRCALQYWSALCGRGCCTTSQSHHKGIIIVRNDAIYAGKYGIDEMIVARLECVCGHVDDVVFQITCRPRVPQKDDTLIRCWHKHVQCSKFILWVRLIVGEEGSDKGVNFAMS